MANESNGGASNGVTASSDKVNTPSEVVRSEQPLIANATNGHSSSEKANAHNERTNDSIPIENPNAMMKNKDLLRPSKFKLNPFSVPNIQHPLQKKSRFNEYEPTKEWYDSMEESIGEISNFVAMIQIKQSNGATLLHMQKLENESKQLKAQIEHFKNGWAKETHE